MHRSSTPAGHVTSPTHHVGMRLLLLRHAQTPSNVSGQLDARTPGPGLTDLGERQAEAVPDALAGVPIDRIAVSTLLRTQLTAAPLAGRRGLDPVITEGVEEIGAGDLSMRSDAEAWQGYRETVTAWALGDLDRRMPGGQDGWEFMERFDAAIAGIAATGSENPVVVSHGGAIRAWAWHRTGGGALTGTTPLSNTGLVELDGDPGSGWRLVSWPSTPVGGAHLIDAEASDPTAGTGEVPSR